jgi:hypothetical protein
VPAAPPGPALPGVAALPGGSPAEAGSVRDEQPIRLAETSRRADAKGTLFIATPPIISVGRDRPTDNRYDLYAIVKLLDTIAAFASRRANGSLTRVDT